MNTMTRDDHHPIADVLRAVCREQLGRVPALECYIVDDTERDVMEVRFCFVTGVGRIELPEFRVEGQARMTDDGWYAEMRREMRGWFRALRKGRGL